MRVVITGGCGFLGRRVALGLLERSDVDELVLFERRLDGFWRLAQRFPFSG